MDVFSISGGNAPKAPDGGSVDPTKRSGSHRGEGASKSGAARGSDHYAGSDAANRVATLVDTLIAGPEGEIRAELVDQFRALIQLPEFDSPENAARAAEALLRGDS